MKQIFKKGFNEITGFFKDLLSTNETYSRITVITFILCILPAVINLTGFDFGVKYDLNLLNPLYHNGNDIATFNALHILERGSFIHTILETICVLTAIFTVVFALINYEIKKDVVTIVISTTLFCAGLLDAFHLLASDQLIWSPDVNDTIIFTWILSRSFNAGIILFASIIILSNIKFFDRLTYRSVYQIPFFFILITILTIIIVFFNVSLLPTTTLQNSFVSRPLELIPMIVFVVNGMLVLPEFYKRNPSIFSFALLLSMLPAVSTQIYILFSAHRFDNYFIIARITKALSYLIPFVGIIIDYLSIYTKEKETYGKLNTEVIEKEKAQNLLSGVLESSTDGIMAFQSVRNDQNKIVDFRWTLVNDSAERLIRKKRSDLLDKRLLDIMPENKKEGLFDLYVNVVETGQVLNHEHYYPHDGINKWLNTVAVKLNDGLALTFKDITKVKNTQLEILKYQKELENKVGELNRSNTELEQFAYVASHDLQEPLRKIQAFGDRLTTKFSDSMQEEGKDYIARMKNAASRMQKLINDLLNFSRVKRSNNKFEKVDLNDLLKDVLSDLEARIAPLSASVNIDPLPVIEGDKSQLGQLFQNLLSNSLKFAAQGISPIIKISYRLLPGKELTEKYNILSDIHHFEFSVQDNGIGFDNKYLDKIFTIFQRLHGRNEYEGTGIGLAICRKVVENHRGIITANSQPGIGTTFFIILPQRLEGMIE